MNVTDEDGDTPLYVVENVDTARFLVEHGAVVARQNHEGQTVRVSATCRTLGPQMPALGFQTLIQARITLLPAVHSSRFHSIPLHR